MLDDAAPQDLREKFRAAILAEPKDNRNVVANVLYDCLFARRHSAELTYFVHHQTINRCGALRAATPRSWTCSYSRREGEPSIMHPFWAVGLLCWIVALGSLYSAAEASNRWEKFRTAILCTGAALFFICGAAGFIFLFIANNF